MSYIKYILNRLCFKRNEDITKSSLPEIIEYKVQEKLINHECIICLDEFNTGENVSLIKCGHVYHTICLYTWMIKKPVCPLCDEELIIE